MAQKTINIGTANDGTGDPIRSAFSKVNDNFTELFNDETSGEVNSITAGDGLAGTSTTGAVTLSVNVDDSTLEINTDSLRIKDGGVVSSKLENNITIQGNLAVDTNTLYVDSTNNRVGIGITAPGQHLDVAGNIQATGGVLLDDNQQLVLSTNFSSSIKGSGADGLMFFSGASERMRLNSSGNLGIGTSNATEKLTVSSSGQAKARIVSTDNGSARLDLHSVGGGRYSLQSLANSDFLIFDEANGHTAARYFDGSSGNWSFFTNNAEKMRIDSSGQVGIGTTSPSATFHVKKNVYGAEIAKFETAGRSLVIGAQSTYVYMGYQNREQFKIAASAGSGRFIFGKTLSDDLSNMLQVQGNSYFEGNVGIGTTSPASILHISDVNAQIRLQHTGNSFYQSISTDSSNNLKFGTGANGTERMRIDSSGNLGIGVSSVSHKLDINGNVNIASGQPLRWGAGNAEIVNSTYDLIFKTYNGSSSIDEAMRIGSAKNITLSGPLTINTTTDTILNLNVTDDGPVYAAFRRNGDRHAFFGFGGSSDQFSIVNEESSGSINIETVGGSLFLKSNGNCGVGQTNPGGKLEVIGDIRLKDGSGNSNYGAIEAAESVLTIKTFTDTGNATDIIFKPNNTEKMRLNSTGLGIGTTSLDSLLHLKDASEPQMRIENSDTTLVEGQVIGGILFKQNDSTAGGTGISGRIQMRASRRPDNNGFFGTVSDMDFLVSNASNGAATDNATKTAMSIRAGTGAIGIGTLSPTALLDVSSTTNGVLLPRMTTTQVNAISSPENGLTVYNTTLNTLCFYNGTSWQKVTTANM